MARRRVPDHLKSWPVHVPPVLDWAVSSEFRWHGRHLTPGTEVSIKGERGRYRFIRHVQRPNGIEWVDVWGGATGCEAFRSFRPDRIRTVHRIARTRASHTKGETQ